MTPTDYFFLVYFIFINILSFAQFYHDKAQANEGGWRLSELSLLTTVFFGGGIGAKLGQRVFRHKTRKEPFRTHLNICTVIGLVGFAMLAFVPDLRNGLVALADEVLSGIAEDRSQSGPSPSRTGETPRPFRPGGGSTF